MESASTTSYSPKQWHDTAHLGFDNAAAGSMYFQGHMFYDQQTNLQQCPQPSIFGPQDTAELTNSLQLSPKVGHEIVRSSPTFVPSIPQRSSPTTIPHTITTTDDPTAAQRRQSSYGSGLYGQEHARSQLAIRRRRISTQTSPLFHPYALPTPTIPVYHPQPAYQATNMMNPSQPFTSPPVLGMSNPAGQNNGLFSPEPFQPSMYSTVTGSADSYSGSSREYTSSDSDITPPMDYYNPLPPAHPVGTSAPPTALPPLQTPIRTVGQRVDADTILLNGSFRGSDNDSRRRRAVLDDIMRQDWYINHDQEPHISGPHDPLARGLGSVGRSIYTVFLAESPIVSGGSSDEHPATTTTGWICLFDGNEDGGCKRGKKRFGRLERAVEHVRSHMGHRPFACNDQCQKGLQGKPPCQKRFFAGGYLEDHLKRRERRINCPDCGQSTQVQNLTRHQQRHRATGV